MKTSPHKRILFLANIPVKGVKSSYGGATVLAENILNFISKNNKLEVIHKPIRNTWIPKVHILDHIFWVFKIPFYLRKVDVVSIHGTWDFNFTTAPFIIMWCKFFKKKVIFHSFGGDFHVRYSKYNPLFRKLIDQTLLKADKVFFETKELIKYFSPISSQNLEWLPNARERIISKLEPKEFSKKFVFISRVIPEKGVLEIIEASKHLPSDYTVDIYGPIDERYLDKSIFQQSNARYKGILNPNEVLKVLQEYDVLLLPTYFFGEGYPGIIIEAQSLGIPTISTSWNSIEEIVQDGYNGLIIPIRDAQKLLEAILFFNAENFDSFRTNAFKSFENFDKEIVFQKLIHSYLND